MRVTDDSGEETTKFTDLELPKDYTNDINTFIKQTCTIMKRNLRKAALKKLIAEQPGGKVMAPLNLYEHFIPADKSKYIFVEFKDWEALFGVNDRPYLKVGLKSREEKKFEDSYEEFVRKTPDLFYK